MILAPGAVVFQITVKGTHAPYVYGAAYIGFGISVVQGKTAQNVEHPEIGVIGCKALCGVQVILHIAIQAAVIKELSLAYGKAVVCYKDHGIIHEHIHQARTQFLTRLVATREELLIVTRCHIARQFHGLLQMVADGITDHLCSPMLKRGIDFISGVVTAAYVVPVVIPVPDVSLGQEGVTQGLVFLDPELGQK